MKKIALLLLVGVLLLTGCGSSSKLSFKEMCIKKQDGDEKICIGMSRPEAESVAGKGRKPTIKAYGGRENEIIYENGLHIDYRDNKVAIFTLGEDSKEYYEHYPSGIKVGDHKDSVKAKYGEKIAKEKETDLVNYFMYTIIKGEIVDKNDISLETEYKGEPEDYLQYVVYYDQDGYINLLSFGEAL